MFHLDVAYVTIALYACFKHMFQVFHMFQTHVTNVLSGCYKSRSRCCICCYVYTRMFQAYVLSVSSIFQTYVQVFHLDVSKVDLGEHMFHWP